MTDPARDLIAPADAAALWDDGRWPARLAEMVDFVADALAAIEPGRDARELRLLACAAVVRLAEEFGGTNWYLPKSDAISRALRNLQMWGEHDGTVDGPHGIRALARRHRLAEQQVWAVLREERARHRARVQPRLPGL